jgi:membrane protease YdiL (CAAX protease family)
MLVISGLVLLLLAIVFFAAGKLRPMYRPAAPARAPRGVFVEGFALYLVVHVAMSIGLALAIPKLGLAGLLLLFATVPLVLLGLRSRGVTWAELRHGLGWHAQWGWLREIGWGLVGYIAGLPLVLVGFLVTSLLMRFSTEQPSHPILEWAREPGIWRPVQIYLLACVLAPVVEETMFRGVLFHYLRIRWSFLPSAALVAVIFAALHPQGWTAIPILGSLALVFAGLREWRGSLVAPITAHALNNGAAVTMLLLMTR